MDVGDMPYRHNGEVYCSKECADADTSADENLEFEDLEEDVELEDDYEEYEDSSY
jgi:hypothetical protein